MDGNDERQGEIPKAIAIDLPPMRFHCVGGRAWWAGEEGNGCGLVLDRRLEVLESDRKSVV